MIYLQRHALSADGSPSVEIAVIVDERNAERYAEDYESRGYSRCSLDEFRAAWRLRDARDLARLRAAAVAEGQLVASQCGADRPLDGILRALNALQKKE
jgi:hypothetical protein